MKTVKLVALSVVCLGLVSCDPAIVHSIKDAAAQAAAQAALEKASSYIVPQK